MVCNQTRAGNGDGKCIQQSLNKYSEEGNAKKAKMPNSHRFNKFLTAIYKFIIWKFFLSIGKFAGRINLERRRTKERSVTSHWIYIMPLNSWIYDLNVPRTKFAISWINFPIIIFLWPLRFHSFLSVHFSATARWFGRISNRWFKISFPFEWNRYYYHLSVCVVRWDREIEWREREKAREREGMDGGVAGVAVLRQYSCTYGQSQLHPMR